MSLKSHWKCPYCPIEGTQDFSTHAIEALIEHLSTFHLDQHFQQVIARLDKREFIGGRLSLQLLRGQFKYIGGEEAVASQVTGCPVDQKLALPASAAVAEGSEAGVKVEEVENARKVEPQE
jgi:hypothetical protein